ncbi:MAG: hypothetical protein GX665_11810 [Gammaproteobacteria bacterium]|nr:hypothetical protein [Gammaproteobacteria bacterium]
MEIPVLLFLAFIGGVIGQLLSRKLLVSVIVPAAVLSLWILFAEILQPYKSGGASMWPIALFFITTYSAGAAYVGAFLIMEINKNRQ